MTQLELVNQGLYNTHVRFVYQNKVHTGFIIDATSFMKGEKSIGYVLIPTKNLVKWRIAETQKDEAKMRRLATFIDITEIEAVSLLPICKEEINRKITDWKNRLNELYNSIECWLENKQEFKINRVNNNVLHEGIMQNFQVRRQTVTSADVFKDETHLLSLKPAGLWVIGANGKIDITLNDTNYILVDLSKNYRRAEWAIYLWNKKNDKKKFDKSIFLKLIKQSHGLACSTILGYVAGVIC